jgi:hypothetical protein
MHCTLCMFCLVGAAPSTSFFDWGCKCGDSTSMGGLATTRTFKIAAFALFLTRVSSTSPGSGRAGDSGSTTRGDCQRSLLRFSIHAVYNTAIALRFSARQWTAASTQTRLWGGAVIRSDETSHTRIEQSRSGRFWPANFPTSRHCRPSTRHPQPAIGPQLFGLALAGVTSPQSPPKSRLSPDTSLQTIPPGKRHV